MLISLGEFCFNCIFWFKLYKYLLYYEVFWLPNSQAYSHVLRIVLRTANWVCNKYNYLLPSFRFLSLLLCRSSLTKLSTIYGVSNRASNPNEIIEITFLEFSFIKCVNLMFQSWKAESGYCVSDIFIHARSPCSDSSPIVLIFYNNLISPKLDYSDFRKHSTS